MGPQPRDPVERFLEKVSVDLTTGCWLYTGCLDKDGYGIFGPAFGKNAVKAHRFSYITYREEIPAGLVIDHLCRVRNCVNPDHLRLVTSKENVHAAGSIAPAKRNASKTHCNHGHAYTGDNLKFSSKGRRCRECFRRYSRERSQRKKLALQQASQYN